jgi:hypothetical protein
VLQITLQLLSIGGNNTSNDSSSSGAQKKNYEMRNIASFSASFSLSISPGIVSFLWLCAGEAKEGQSRILKRGTFHCVLIYE